MRRQAKIVAVAAVPALCIQRRAWVSNASGLPISVSMGAHPLTWSRRERTETPPSARRCRWRCPLDRLGHKDSQRRNDHQHHPEHDHGGSHARDVMAREPLPDWLRQTARIPPMVTAST